MSLKNMTIKTGGTIAVTGGTDVTFTDVGSTSPNVLKVQVNADSDYRTRRSISYKIREATVQSDGSYSKVKRAASITMPFITASGATVFNVLRLELDIHPEAEATLRAQMLSFGAQIFFDTDAADFWSVGSLN